MICENKSCENAATFICSACKVSTYCSKPCQREDWSKFHHITCPVCGGRKKYITFKSVDWRDKYYHNVKLDVHGSYVDRLNNITINVQDKELVESAFKIIKEMKEKYGEQSIEKSKQVGEITSWFGWWNYDVLSSEAKKLSEIFLEIDENLGKGPGGLK